MRNVSHISNPPAMHWVGDGFPVRSLFSPRDGGHQLSPFLLLDYAGPQHFEPAQTPHGVGEHPHRGFETVTIVYQGEVAHRDSTGAGGVIGPGDVQWMTAAAGILHDEFHSPAFSRTGGVLEMVQLWVNLHARHKMSAPGYQDILDARIPRVKLANGAGTLRIIAGEHDGSHGAARTFTPMNVWDLQLRADHATRLVLPNNHNAMLVVLKGEARINGHAISDAQTAMLDRGSSGVVIKTNTDTRALLLSGEPIDEPMVARGPFVMNSQAEINAAFADFRAGRFGQIAS